MRTTTLFFFFFTALGLAACSSSNDDPFGPDPDYATLDKHFTSPNGTFTNANAGSAFSKYGDARQSSQQVDVGGATAAGGGGTSSTAQGLHSQALRILDMGKSGAATTCSALAHGDTTGSCACPAGGSFQYDFSGIRALQESSTGPIDVALKVRLNACVSDAWTLDGREFVRLHADRTGSTVDLNSLSMLLVADFTASKGAETHTLDLAARYQKGDIEIAIQVDDGWITIAGSSNGTDGTFTVRDRDGSWTCNVVGKAGSCTGSNGDTRKF